MISQFFPRTINFDYDSDTVHISCASYVIENVNHFWFVLFESICNEEIDRLHNDTYTPFVFRTNRIYNFSRFVTISKYGNVVVSFKMSDNFDFYVFPGICNMTMSYNTSGIAMLNILNDDSDMVVRSSNSIQAFDELKYSNYELLLEKNPFIHIVECYDSEPFIFKIRHFDGYSNVELSCSDSLISSTEQPVITGSFTIDLHAFKGWYSNLNIFNACGYDPEQIYFTYFKYPFRTSIYNHYSSNRESGVVSDNVEILKSSKVYLFENTTLTIRNREALQIRDSIYMQDNKLLDNLTLDRLHPSRLLIDSFRYYLISPFKNEKIPLQMTYDIVDVNDVEKYETEQIRTSLTPSNLFEINNDVLKINVIFRQIRDNSSHIHYLRRIPGLRHIKFKVLYNRLTPIVNNLENPYDADHNWTDFLNISEDVTDLVDFDIELKELLTNYIYAQIDDNLYEVPNPHSLDLPLIRMDFRFKSRISNYLYLVAELDVQYSQFERAYEFAADSLHRANLNIWSRERSELINKSLCSNKIFIIADTIGHQTVPSPLEHYISHNYPELKQYDNVQLVITYDDIKDISIDSYNSDYIALSGVASSKYVKCFIPPGSVYFCLINPNKEEVDIRVNHPHLFTSSTNNIDQLTSHIRFVCDSLSYGNVLSDRDFARWLHIKSQLSSIDHTRISSYYDCIDKSSTIDFFLNYYTSNTIPSSFETNVPIIDNTTISCQLSSDVIVIGEDKLSTLLSHYPNGFWLFCECSEGCQLFVDIDRTTYNNFYDLNIDEIIMSKYMTLPLYYDETHNSYIYPDLVYNENVPSTFDPLIFYDATHNDDISITVSESGYYYMQCVGFDKMICDMKIEGFSESQVDSFINDPTIDWLIVNEHRIEPRDMCTEVIDLYEDKS